MALISVGKYIQLVNADASKDAFDRSEAYRFAGRVFAFIDGPVSGEVKTTTRDLAMRKVMFKSDVEMQKAFQFDYELVTKKYSDLMDSKTKVDQSDAQQDANIRKVKFEQLATKEAQLHEREQTVLKERSDVRQAAAEHLEVLRSQDIPLANHQSALTNTLANNYYNQAWHNYLYHTPTFHYSHGKGKVKGKGYSHKGYLHNHADHFYHWNNNWHNGILRGQLYGVQNQRAALLDQYALANASASNQIHSLNRELKDVNKVKNRTRSEKLRALKPSTVTSSRSRAINSKAKSIMTYEQFPLEIERQLILANIK